MRWASSSISSSSSRFISARTRARFTCLPTTFSSWVVSPEAARSTASYRAAPTSGNCSSVFSASLTNGPDGNWAGASAALRSGFSTFPSSASSTRTVFSSSVATETISLRRIMATSSSSLATPAKASGLRNASVSLGLPNSTSFSTAWSAVALTPSETNSEMARIFSKTSCAWYLTWLLVVSPPCWTTRAVRRAVTEPRSNDSAPRLSSPSSMAIAFLRAWSRVSETSPTAWRTARSADESFLSRSASFLLSATAACLVSSSAARILSATNWGTPGRLDSPLSFSPTAISASAAFPGDDAMPAAFLR